MKKTLKIFSLLLVLSMALSVFAGCSLSGEGEKVTVTWYNGSEVLKTEEVVKGSKVTTWTPEESGKTFHAWYKDSAFTTFFNFNDPINSNTSIYAAFVSNDFVADTTEYYLIGAGTGDLRDSNWTHENSQYDYVMFNENVPGENVFSIEIEMHAGDAFLICHDGVWDGQTGIGRMAGVELTSETEAVVKDEMGLVVFTGKQEFGHSYDMWNITLAEGRDGIYKFTYTTDVEDPYNNLITWELIESIDPSDIPVGECAMYFIGTFNGWNTLYEEGSDYMLYDNEDGTWEGSIEITTDMYDINAEIEAGYPCAALKLYDALNGRWVGYNGDGNLYLTAGIFNFKYDVKTNTFTYEVIEGGEIPEIKDDGNHDMYLVGTMNDANGTWEVSDEYALTQSANKTSWSITITVTEDMYRDWTVNEGASTLSAAFKVYNKSTNEWIGINGNNLFLTAGTYEIIYYVDGNTIEYRDVTNGGGSTGGTEGTEVTIYYKNTDNWASVYTWIWIEGGPNFTGGAWPGKAMTPVAGVDGWYSITVTVTTTTNLQVIFSNNGAPQTADLSYTGLNYWVGSVAYATMEEAEEAASGVASKNWSDLYLRGTMNNWGTSNRLELDEEGNSYIVITLAEGDTFKVANAGWDVQYNATQLGDTENFTEAATDQNIQVVNGGEYKVVVTVDGELVIEPLVAAE